MRPIAEQVILVTGATDGHGKGVALELAKRGATLLVHGRSEQRIADTLAALRSAGNARCRGYQADLASLDDVRALGKELLAKEERLDVLVNNAGIGTRVPGGGARTESRDGFELRFAVNYLAPFLLTRLLLPSLKASAPARIVNVSSLGQQAIDFADVMLERDYSGVRAYCQSKLAQILSTIDDAEVLGGTGVTVNALHPATYMPTKIVPSPSSTLEEGVEATVRLVVDPALDAVSGRFFNGLRESDADAQAYDAAARRKLRELSERLTVAGK
ncbi:MAG TPA: SDR family NAD(P)-dependent oxidoreductase [Polyangiaceae bacterium]|jgi:NAD(P)-dependent dehydrogenase (short-subunit alcohol dehydrogenase family)|nr:SDR family NAD(P)-dependent oxidoreductase [Polyangiaceae bacterium]